MMTHAMQWSLLAVDFASLQRRDRALLPALRRLGCVSHEWRHLLRSHLTLALLRQNQYAMGALDVSGGQMFYTQWA